MKKVTSLFLTFAVAAACTLPAPFTAQAAQAAQAEIVNSVSFRGKPAVNGGFIRYLKKGEKVAVISQPNAYWFQVKDREGVIGYISAKSKYTQVTGTAVSEPVSATAATGGDAVVVNSVSFRTSPSTGAERIRYLKSGETVTVIGKPNSYWYHVKDSSGVTGYTSTNSHYIQLTDGSAVEAPASAPVSAPATETAAAPAAAGGNAVVVNSVSFRTSPSTGAERIRYLKSGETVTVIGKPNSYWYHVKDSSGVTGYTSTNSHYIQLTDESAVEAPASAPVTTPVSSPAAAVGGSAVIESVVAAGMRYLGTPYEYGSSRSTTATFDCSDLIRQMFIDGAGLTLPADSRGQGSYVKQLGTDSKSLSQLKRGDVLFFMSYKGSSASDYSSVNKDTARITHAALYLGDGQILHTYSKTSGGVRIDRIGGNHWEHRFLYGGSVIK